MPEFSPKIGIQRLYTLSTGLIQDASVEAGLSAKAVAARAVDTDAIRAASQRTGVTTLSAIDHLHAALKVSTFHINGRTVDLTRLSEARRQAAEGVQLLASEDARQLASASQALDKARGTLLGIGVNAEDLSSSSMTEAEFTGIVQRGVDGNVGHIASQVPPEIDADVREGMLDPETWLAARPPLPGGAIDSPAPGDEDIEPVALGRPKASGAAAPAEAPGSTPVSASPSFTLERLDPKSPLATFGSDATLDAAAGKVDPVFGRDHEIGQMATVLARRTKNNPLLLGEPGVGKTATVEGLALKIVKGEVPEKLRNRRLIVLDTSSITAGSGEVGKAEDRWKAIFKQLDELRENGENPIVFIDELHTLMGTGQSATGSTSEILKSRLARANSGFVAATTTDEHRKLVEGNAAFDRRWQPVAVDEPSVAQTVSILRLARPTLEAHHGVRITDSALQAAASYADRYITDRFMPDKAIDLVDLAMARLSMASNGRPQELVEAEATLAERQSELRGVIRTGAGAETSGKLRSEIAQLKGTIAGLQERVQAEQPHATAITAKLADLDAIGAKLDTAEAAGNDSEADRIVDEELTPALDQLDALRETYASTVGDRLPLVPAEVNDTEIARQVEERTGIPVASLRQSDAERLLHLEDDLHRYVIGQDVPVKAVAGAVRRNRAGVSDPKRPTGSFIFGGPTGVGKTELARALNAFLLGVDPDSQAAKDHGLIRIDMGDYQEKHAVARLTGAPPGYVGYEEGGQLTESVRRQPYSVVLFDEIEKAHPDVYDALLPILEDGHTKDAQGRVVDFSNTVIIMTTNLKVDGPDGLKALAAHGFRPEFVNRVDDRVQFTPVDTEMVKGVVDTQLARLGSRLVSPQGAGVSLAVDDAARGALARWGCDPELGARPVKRAIQRHLEDPLTDALLEGRIQKGQTVNVTLAPDGESLAFAGVPTAA